MSHLKVGDKAPNFETVDEKGQRISLEDYKGKKLILFTYPKALTPGCTAEACDLSDHYQELIEKGFSILGLSADAPKLQQKFSEKYQFPFPLIPDTDKVILKLYGSWGPKMLYGRAYEGIYRITFIIDEQGNIEKIFDKVKTKEHAAQILAAY